MGDVFPRAIGHSRVRSIAHAIARSPTQRPVSPSLRIFGRMFVRRFVRISHLLFGDSLARWLDKSPVLGIFDSPAHASFATRFVESANRLLADHRLRHSLDRPPAQLYILPFARSVENSHNMSATRPLSCSFARSCAPSYFVYSISRPFANLSTPPLCPMRPPIGPNSTARNSFGRTSISRSVGRCIARPLMRLIHHACAR